MRVASLQVALFAAVVGLLTSRRVLADAVPPPPTFCLPGEVGVTSHRGPQCIPKAPTDCAPGYRGELGGRCVMAACSTDKECDSGLHCVQVEACQEERELRWNGWNWSPYEASGNRRGMKVLPQPEGAPPKAWMKLRICGQDGACNAPAECRPMGLCYPSKGDPKASVVPTAPSAETLPDGVYPSDLVVSPPSNGEGSRSSCRRGCAVTSNSSDVASWLAVPFLFATGIVRRRRSARSATR